MPIITNFDLPHSADALDLPTESNPAFFIAFLASPEPATGTPWCPDVRAALPVLRTAFSAPAAPQVAFINVGLQPEWRDLSNIYRTTWKVTNLPTLVRYERIGGKVQEVGRLVEGEILNQERLQKLITSSSARI